MYRGADIGKGLRSRSLGLTYKCTSRLDSRKGRPRRKRSLIKLKMAVFNPIPSASVIRASKVNPGDLRNCRKAKRRSVIISKGQDLQDQNDSKSSSQHLNASTTQHSFDAPTGAIGFKLKDAA